MDPTEPPEVTQAQVDAFVAGMRKMISRPTNYTVLANKLFSVTPFTEEDVPVTTTDLHLSLGEIKDNDHAE